MKIVRVTGAYGLEDSTGPSRQQYLLDQALARRGHEIVVYTLSTRRVPEVQRVGNVVIKKYPSLVRFGMLRLPRGMFSDLRKEECEIIHAHGYRNPLTDLAALISLLEKKPLVITPHGSVSAFKFDLISPTDKAVRYLYDAMTLKFSLRVVRKIVATSTMEQEEILSFGIPCKKVVLIPHGILTSPLPTGTGPRSTPSSRCRLFMASRISSIRNIEFLIQVFRKVKDEIPCAELYISGSDKPHSQIFYDAGYKNKVLRMCETLKLRDSVHFTGELRGEELYDQYRLADIFVWTSRYDNFGQPLVEAASFGLPIVSTKVGIAPFLVGANEGGFLVEHDDVSGMARCIVKLLRDHSLYRKASEHVSKMASRFTVERMTSDYENLYMEVARAHGKSDIIKGSS
jgi:glycosyltransferase involved in cell wall biosynthesis